MYIYIFSNITDKMILKINLFTCMYNKLNIKM